MGVQCPGAGPSWAAERAPRRALAAAVSDWAAAHQQPAAADSSEPQQVLQQGKAGMHAAAPVTMSEPVLNLQMAPLPHDPEHPLADTGVLLRIAATRQEAPK